MERFSAAEVLWQTRAACTDDAASQYDFTPVVETPAGLEAARSTWCNACPVRTECLAYALLYRMSGYWGGTSTAERTLLGYARNRVKCPVCGCKSLVRTAEGHQICQSCATSWTAPVSRGAPEGISA